ncbi:HNH endonuclease [Isoptericola sp. 4D.3]|uniref:HNH endonuclease n=1 Tax=Isoptericola peretonis TaxID=2918523 RepID=A0ABT0IYL2_9MICO|nr:HNH endonuclease [Isoptericola sp. 4D.3]
MNDWLYPVNPRSDTWGYFWDDGEPISPQDLLSGQAAERENADIVGTRQSWRLPRRLSGFGAGDLVWVRESQPVAAIVGVGRVITDPEPDPDGRGLRFQVDFAGLACRRLAHAPFAIELTTRLQTVRRPDPAELSQLRSHMPDSLVVSDTSPVGKVRRAQLVTQRQGQAAFRDSLLDAYGAQCAVTGCDVPAALQAAHIQPYDGHATNVVENGLLLRADIHNLFDLGMLWVDDDLHIRVCDALLDSQYGSLDRRMLTLPHKAEHRPNSRRLARHRREIADQVA